MRFIWYNIILSGPINFIVAPIAYLFRKSAQKKKNVLWYFLSDENMYGDKNWRPKLKNKFLRAWLWMLRNPLQNYYWKDYVDGVESNFIGHGTVKFGTDILSWRTMYCADTQDNHGKILDFEKSKFGTQDITFIRTDKDGNVQKCYRKSHCKPFKFLFRIILVKRRRGHENGLMQYNFSFPTYSYKKNKQGWKKWEKAEWITIKANQQ